MPWKETCVRDERMRFIARLLDGEAMSRLCEEFGISRKTGYKIWNRYQNTGVYALVDRSRKPHRFGNQLPEQIERTLVRLKREKPHLGCAQDSGTPDPSVSQLKSTGGEHRSRRSGSQRPGELSETATTPSPGHSTVEQPKSE